MVSADVAVFFIEPCLLLCWDQDSDDEGNDDIDNEEKMSVKREFSVRSPSPPAEDSETEMTEELKEELLVSLIFVSYKWTCFAVGKILKCLFLFL